MSGNSTKAMNFGKGFLGLGLFVALAGCATTVPNSKSAAQEACHPLPRLSAEELKDSAVDIVYELGRTERRLSAEEDDHRVMGRYLHDQTVLTEGEIDSTKYADFFQKAYEFVQVPRRVPGSDGAPCHAPFTVTVRILKDVKVSTGCRSSDEGALSHLVKEGEFLIYSKK